MNRTMSVRRRSQRGPSSVLIFFNKIYYIFAIFVQSKTMFLLFPSRRCFIQSCFTQSFFFQLNFFHSQFFSRSCFTVVDVLLFEVMSLNGKTFFETSPVSIPRKVNEVLVMGHKTEKMEQNFFMLLSLPFYSDIKQIKC